MAEYEDILIISIFIAGFVAGSVGMAVADTFKEQEFITSICKMRYGNSTFVDFHTELAGADGIYTPDVYVNGTFIGKIVNEHTCEVHEK